MGMDINVKVNTEHLKETGSTFREYAKELYEDMNHMSILSQTIDTYWQSTTWMPLKQSLHQIQQTMLEIWTEYAPLADGLVEAAEKYQHVENSNKELEHIYLSKQEWIK